MPTSPIPTSRSSLCSLLVGLCVGLLGLLGPTGCSDGGGDAADLAGPDLAPPALHNIHVKIALDDDGMGGVVVRAQNGSMTPIPRTLIVGKSYGWVILKGGEQVANGKTLEAGGGVIDDHLSADFTTKRGYADGPWELALLILMASPDIMNAPHPGDLAAFSLTPPSDGDPPLTGTSVRVSLRGADTTVALNNFYFIRL